MPTLPDHSSSSPNSAPELKIDVRAEGPVKVIAFKGHIGSVLADADRKRIQAEIQPGAQLALDFTEVREISGVGLRRLLLLTRHVRSLGGVLAVRGASEQVRAIAEASGFGELFRRSVPLPIPDGKPTLRERIDLYPTHSYRDFALRPGIAQPLGATALSQGVNFAVYSRHATKCTLVLYEHGVAEPFAEIPFLPEFRIGDIHAMIVFDLDPDAIEYAFRMEGPFAPREGHRFDGERELLDPAARAVSWRPAWGQRDQRIATPRGRLIARDFDWQDDRPLGTPAGRAGDL